LIRAPPLRVLLPFSLAKIVKIIENRKMKEEKELRMKIFSAAQGV